jgi:hypothetical protein
MILLMERIEREDDGRSNRILLTVVNTFFTTASQELNESGGAKQNFANFLRPLEAGPTDRY